MKRKSNKSNKSKLEALDKDAISRHLQTKLLMQLGLKLSDKRTPEQDRAFKRVQEICKNRPPLHIEVQTLQAILDHPYLEDRLRYLEPKLFNKLVNEKSQLKKGRPQTVSIVESIPSKHLPLGKGEPLGGSSGKPADQKSNKPLASQLGNKSRLHPSNETDGKLCQNRREVCTEEEAVAITKTCEKISDNDNSSTTNAVTPSNATALIVGVAAGMLMLSLPFWLPTLIMVSATVLTLLDVAAAVGVVITGACAYQLSMTSGTP